MKTKSLNLPGIERLTKDDKQFVEDLITAFYNQDQEEIQNRLEITNREFDAFFKDKNL